MSTWPVGCVGLCCYDPPHSWQACGPSRNSSDRPRGTATCLPCIQLDAGHRMLNATRRTGLLPSPPVRPPLSPPPPAPRAALRSAARGYGAPAGAAALGLGSGHLPTGGPIHCAACHHCGQGLWPGLAVPGGPPVHASAAWRHAALLRLRPNGSMCAWQRTGRGRVGKGCMLGAKPCGQTLGQAQQTCSA